MRLLGKRAEIGAAVVIELNGIPYAPLHDIAGSVIALLDANGSIAKSYRYNFFSRRYYAAKFGRFFREINFFIV